MANGSEPSKSETPWNGPSSRRWRLRSWLAFDRPYVGSALRTR